MGKEYYKITDPNKLYNVIITEREQGIYEHETRMIPDKFKTIKFRNIFTKLYRLLYVKYKTRPNLMFLWDPIEDCVCVRFDLHLKDLEDTNDKDNI